ncbi:hypothetical protein DBR47_16725 [Paucibacter sp. KBW04]|uniref:hypothetical protein n=1 Tax=Paucibacter sp. KBW04 TaxID=2153361 RepID=UPI000F58E988|nr:hypothetical protein [Paucibacter sp. KBW04]RQO56943.1 hypothetical protein DBR47_16725 [Paucibacter sp. KBW04]
MTTIELLRKFAATKLPIRILAAEEFNGAEQLAKLGYIKLAIPPMKKGRNTYGQQDPALVLAITPSGKRAIAT